MTEKQANAIKRVIAAGDVTMTPKDAADIIRAAPQTLRESCKIGRQGFPVCIIGDTIKIPVIPFFEYWGIRYETRKGGRHAGIIPPVPGIDKND